MVKDKVINILEEITGSQGFVNIDKNDIDEFKANVEVIDAEKVSCKIEEIGMVLYNAISSIRKKNDDKQMRKLLFVIRVSKESHFMEYICDVHEVIDTLEERTECRWGLLTIDKLSNNQLELIIAIGF